VAKVIRPQFAKLARTAISKQMVGGLPVTEGGDTLTRAAILLWGASTVGKTTFAATAPGVKLWLSFGDNEHTSVMRRKDVRVVKLYELGVEELFKQAQHRDNPFGLDQYLAANEDVATVVCDSATALAYLALHQSVYTKKVGAGKGFTPSIEAPGLSAYGGRNQIVLEVLTGLLRITAKHNVHFIVTAHEADATTKIEQGKELIDYIGIMLGGQLVNNMTWRLSEIWYISQQDHGDKSRRIAFRPTRLRKPMKTRMFDDTGQIEFTLKYDARKPDKGQMTIAKWVNDWLDEGGALQPVPK